MQIEDIKKIGVIGSGTMGRGIAICSALSEIDTIIYDIKDEIINSSKSLTEKDLSKSVEKKKLTEEKKSEALRRTIFTSEFDDLSDCDFIIEAALESIDLKKDIFGRLDKICREDAILSTNTSSLSVTNISTAVIKNPGRVIGMHFFNPANIMKLVEIVKGDFTSDEVLKTTVELTKKMNKVPVVAKDTPAFIVNRIARPFYGEALKILSEGTSDAETIDKLMKACGGFAMGPFELMDLIGIDVNFSVTKSVYEAYFNDPKYRPSFIQKKMVDANLLGRKTGRGFYNYEK
ncbi:MAG: 3-hydroxyacyl-CoA dehydrogenase NAD-binding domain-containing protein [Ignavibacteria bacterium]